MIDSKKNIFSILIVDDDPQALDLYKKLLFKKIKAQIDTTKFPHVAITNANKHFYDFILIDVSMNYHGQPFGGVEIYNNLMNRYGNSSLIVYSKYITDDFLKQYNYQFNFIEKGEDPNEFISDVIRQINHLRTLQTCFVAMPFSKIYDKYFKIIKKSIESASYRCIRVDNQEFTRPIVEKIFAEIADAKIIVFFATDKNPNAFFECGYAIALKKEVITLTDSYDNLPFDIKHRNSIAYGESMKKFESDLSSKLIKCTQLNLQ